MKDVKEKKEITLLNGLYTIKGEEIIDKQGKSIGKVAKDIKRFALEKILKQKL